MSRVPGAAPYGFQGAGFGGWGLSLVSFLLSNVYFLVGQRRRVILEGQNNPGPGLPLFSHHSVDFNSRIQILRKRTGSPWSCKLSGSFSGCGL